MTALRLGAVLLTGVLGCGSSLAGQLAEPPEYEPEGQTKCAVRKSQDKPLIVEWPSADRAELEAVMKQGPVVVRYDGCAMRLLSHCRVEGNYAYDAVTPKRDRLVIRDVDELYTAIPVGAANLEAKLEKAGELSVEMTLVGRYRLDDPQRSPDQLQGACVGATHVIAGLTVGAFEFFAGAEVEVGAGVEVLAVGGGSRGTAKREKLAADGQAEACAAATAKAPPAGCSAILRVEVVGLSWPSTPQCPLGSSWNGAACVASTVVCPPGATFDGRRCVTTQTVAKVECPHGTSWNGSRCVAGQVACPQGSAWDGLTCRPLAKGQPPTCPAGSIWDGLMCADASLKPGRNCTGEEACKLQCDEGGNMASCLKLAEMRFHAYGGGNKWAYMDRSLRACRGGLLEACDFAAGVLLGLSGEKDVKDGIEMAEIGCRGGSQKSCTKLGWAYVGGNGVTKDVARGVVMMRRACSEGYTQACTNIESLGYEP